MLCSDTHVAANKNIAKYGNFLALFCDCVAKPTALLQVSQHTARLSLPLTNTQIVKNK